MSELNDKPGISKEMRVSKLRNGAVIDHLRPGSAMKAIQVLGVTDGSTLSVGMFLESSKMGRKDILKIENKILTQTEINKIAVLSPEATLCNIRNYQVVQKIKAHLPAEISGIIRCNNPKCITNAEKIVTQFSVVTDAPLKVRCHYCERAMSGDEVELL
jgi:aspartate carbamoyltransferase regulatory subunit